MNDARFADELFALIAVPRNRHILRRCKEGPKTTSELMEGVAKGKDPRSTDGRRRTAETHLKRMRVLGLLDGAKSPGWVLVAAEVLDLIEAIGRAHSSARLFNDLANRTFRHVLMAMLSGAVARDELRPCGPANEVTKATDNLERYGLVERIDENPKRWRIAALPRPWIEVIARANVLVYALLDDALMLADLQSGDILAGRGGVIFNCSPRNGPGTAMEADHLDRVFEGESLSEDWRRLRARYATQVPRVNPVRPRPCPHPEMLELLAFGTMYSEDEHARRLIFGALLNADPESAAFLKDGNRYVCPDDNHQQPAGAPTACQQRGRRRRAAINADSVTLEELELPVVRWLYGVPVVSDLSIHHAAHFLADDNVLECNIRWTGLHAINPRFEHDAIDTADDIAMWQYVTSRHALRLVERVLLHEHSVSLLPDGLGPTLTPDALTLAAHWNTVELTDARRVLNGYLSSLAEPFAPSPRDYGREWFGSDPWNTPPPAV